MNSPNIERNNDRHGSGLVQGRHGSPHCASAIHWCSCPKLWLCVQLLVKKQSQRTGRGWAGSSQGARPHQAEASALLADLSLVVVEAATTRLCEHEADRKEDRLQRGRGSCNPPALNDLQSSWQGLASGLPSVGFLNPRSWAYLLLPGGGCTGGGCNQ